MIDHDEVQVAGDGELVHRSPYLPYRREDTRVKVYVISTEPIPVRQGWHLARNVKEARAACRGQYGAILEENAAGDNLFLRVLKEPA